MVIAGFPVRPQGFSQYPSCRMWLHNALPHRFVSHHVATLTDVARMALEPATPWRMLHRHYRQLVTSAVGEEYWTLRLETDLNCHQQC